MNKIKIEKLTVTLSITMFLYLLTSVSFACEDLQSDLDTNYHGHLISIGTTLFDGNIVDYITLIDNNGNKHEIPFVYISVEDFETYTQYDYYWQYDNNGSLDNIQIVEITNGIEVLIEDW